MPSKIEATALAVLLVVGFWWWSAGDPASELPKTKESSGERPAAGEPLDKAQPPHATQGPSATSRIESGIDADRRMSASGTGHAKTAGAVDENIDTPSQERISSQSSTSTGKGQDSNERTRNPSGTDKKNSGGDVGPVGPDDPLLGLPLALLDEMPGEGDAVDPEDLPPTEDELAQMDVDGDDEISQWELDRTAARESRVKNHPVKNDEGDGEYPIELENYRKPHIFDAIDTNRDGLMDEPEYRAFLFNADGVLTVRDANQDNMLSVDESGLSQEAFDALDGDRSETLEIRELRDAVALGDID
jgi:hypothetical protein